MDLVDLAIHGVFGQKSDNSDSKKKFQAKICLALKGILVQEIDPWFITKSRIRYTSAI
jgi:hypothetical protein